MAGPAQRRNASCAGLGDGIFQFRYQIVHNFVRIQKFANFLHRMDDGAVIPAAEGAPQFGIGEAQLAAAEIHGDLSGQHQVRAPPRAQDVLRPEVEAPGHGTEDFPAAHRAHAAARADDVFQIRLHGRTAVERGKGFHLAEQPLEQAELDAPLRQIEQLVARKGQFAFPRGALQVAEAHFQIRFQQFQHKAAFQAGAEPFLQMGQFRRRAGMGKDHQPLMRGGAGAFALPFLLKQALTHIHAGREVALPGGFPGNVLQVIQKQGVAVPPELFRPGDAAGRHIGAEPRRAAREDPSRRKAPPQGDGHGPQKLRLARTALAAENQDGFSVRRTFPGDLFRCGKGKGIARVDDEPGKRVLTGIFRIFVMGGGNMRAGRRIPDGPGHFRRRGQGTAQRRILIEDARNIGKTPEKRGFKAGPLVRAKPAGKIAVGKAHHKASVFQAQGQGVKPGFPRGIGGGSVRPGRSEERAQFAFQVFDSQHGGPVGAGGVKIPGNCQNGSRANSGI